ncbi:MAG: N-formylglutamate amidohydrolase [Pacificimonas sp.]
MSAWFLKDTASSFVAPVVLASPHSGRAFPPGFLENVLPDQAALARAEDRLVDELVMPARKAFDLPLLYARWSRTYLDLNRDVTELDPAIVTGAPAFQPSARVKSGLGVLPRIATPGVPLYSEPLSLEEAHRRIREVHIPYHAKLGALLARARAANGFAVLIDCHSMPPLPRRNGRSGPRIVLGDRDGKSADRRITACMESSWGRDVETARNAPYAGGYATAHFGVPAMGTHAVQLEIDRSLYLNMATLTPNADFAAVSARVTDMVGDLLARLGREFGLSQIAAE